MLIGRPLIKTRSVKEQVSAFQDQRGSTTYKDFVYRDNSADQRLVPGVQNDVTAALVPRAVGKGGVDVERPRAGDQSSSLIIADHYID